MKKSVILTLIAIYAVSICVVGYFGLKVRILNPTVYADTVTIDYVLYGDTKIDYKTNQSGKYVRIKDYDEGQSIKIVYTVTPHDATDKSVTFSYDKSLAEITKDGIVTLNKKKVILDVTVTVDAAQNVKDKIKILVGY